MNPTQQGQLLATTLLHNLVEQSKVIAWVDQIISKSEVAEPWMIDISLSKKEENKENSFTLNRKFGWNYEFTLMELVAAITYLYQNQNKPLSQCIGLIALYLDDFQNVGENKAAEELIANLEKEIFLSEYSEESMQKVTPAITELATKSQLEHREVVEFIKNFA
jgi:hypothetical protein